MAGEYNWYTTWSLISAIASLAILGILIKNGVRISRNEVCPLSSRQRSYAG